jgi:hypothetical protein
VNQNSVPGNKQHHVDSGQYPVSVAGMVAGTITFRSNPAGTRFVNITNKGHVFCCGSVVITITGDQQSGFVGEVRGTGVNEPFVAVPFVVLPSWLMAAINQASGPQIFAVQLQEANLDLLGICGG